MTEFERERLDRMLARLDEALVRLTTMEERLAQNGRSLERAFNEIGDIKTKTQRLETAHAVSQTKLGFNERIVWFFVTTAVGVLSYYISHL